MSDDRKPTKSELSQIFYLNKELQMWQREKERLEARIGASSQPMNGMPHGYGVGDPTGNLAQELAQCHLMISRICVEIQIQRNKIIKYIEEVEDSLLRQILFYRCISCMSWHEVAREIGGNHTDKSTRQAFFRHFKKERYDE